MAKPALNINALNTKVTRLLRQAEAEAVTFGRRAGIACPGDCGKCCVTVEIEASPLSLLPLAIDALRSGKAEALLEKTAIAPRAPCLFYTPSSPFHCTVYATRPLVCRLFGFAGRRDKRGLPEFRACRHMDRTPRPGPAPPLFSTWHIRLEGLYPPLAEPMPLRSALRRVLLWLLLLDTLHGCHPPGGRHAA